MKDNQKTDPSPRPWYKEPWPWIVMAGPAIVVVAGFVTFYLAIKTDDTLVSDDYYKEGKNIILQVERDEAAFKNHIGAQVYVQPDMNGVMVITKGNYDTKEPLRLLFIHPTLKKYDQSVVLTQSHSNPFQYTAQLSNKLPATNNWIVRLQDEKNQWRIEARWIVSQGNAVTLIPQHMDTPQNGSTS